MFLAKDRERHNVSVLKYLFSCFFPNHFNVIIYIRLYLFLERNGLPTFFPYRILYHLHGLEIAKGCKIGIGISFPHPKGVLFTRGTELGDNCVINGNVRFVGRHGRYPIIGENTFIGDSVVLLGGIRLERDVVVGAGSVVTKNFGPEVTIAGNPARIINHSPER